MPTICAPTDVWTDAQRRMLEAVVAFTDVHTHPGDEASRRLLLVEMENILNAAHFRTGCTGDVHALDRLVEQSVSSVDFVLV